jgi:outer membrane biosynthesis protein TonB
MKLILALAVLAAAALPVTPAIADKPPHPQHPQHPAKPKPDEPKPKPDEPKPKPDEPKPKPDKPKPKPDKPKPKPDKPKPQPKPHKPKGTHAVAYKAKGVVKSVDAAGKKVTITVGTKNGDTNEHSRAWSGKDVTFDLANARIGVNHDTNGDGKRDLADVKPGDRANVLAKLPRSGPGNEPFAAKNARFKTAKPAS